MNLFRRLGAKRLILTTCTLLFLLLVGRQYHGPQPFLFPGELSELLEVIDRCAALESEATVAGVSIPNTIHQIWRTTDVQTYATEFGPSHESWKAMFEPFNYTVKLWTDVDVLQLIKTQYPWLLSTYEGYTHNIQRADVARLAILHAEGGIYADLDVWPRNVSHTQCLQHLGLQAIFAPTKMGGLSLSNHFFMAQPGSPLLLWALHEAKRRAASPSFRVILPYLNVLWTTGPLMVTAAFREYAWVYNAQGLSVGVLDEDKFRAEVVGHAAGRSWHGVDGVALNYVADHAARTIFIAAFGVMSLVGVVWLVRKRGCRYSL